MSAPTVDSIPAAEPISISLSNAEALVLFDFLSRFASQDKFDIQDQSEQRVLWDMLATLEKVLVEPLSATYEVSLSAARAAVRDDET
jgi:hypothetical protein